jgi:dTDP-4-dehydrorhamnose reductase
MKIVVLGDGLLGSEIVKQTGWDYISRKKDNIDFTKIESWSELLLPYDIIVNCIAYTKTYDPNKELHWNINYKAVSVLTEYCNNHNKKLIHISTDYVYTNSVVEASENDIPIHGNNWYSYTKLLADAYIELKSKNYLICRETHKPNPFPYETAWVDQIGNFDYINKIALIIIKLIESNSEGIYNVGTELKSIFTLANLTSNPYPGLKPENVPSNTSMNLNKLKDALKRFNQ